MSYIKIKVKLNSGEITEFDVLYEGTATENPTPSPVEYKMYRLARGETKTTVDEAGQPYEFALLHIFKDGRVEASQNFGGPTIGYLVN